MTLEFTDADLNSAAVTLAAHARKSKKPVVFDMLKYLEVVPNIVDEGEEELEQLMAKPTRSLADNGRAGELIAASKKYQERVVAYISSLQEKFNGLGFIAEHGNYVLVELGNTDEYSILGNAWAFVLFEKPVDDSTKTLVLDL